MLEKGFIETNLWRKTWQFFVCEMPPTPFISTGRRNRLEISFARSVSQFALQILNTQLVNKNLLVSMDYHFKDETLHESCFEAIKFDVFWVFLGLKTQWAHQIFNETDQSSDYNQSSHSYNSHPSMYQNIFSHFLVTTNVFLKTYYQSFFFQIFNSHAAQSRKLFKLVYKACSFL